MAETHEIRVKGRSVSRGIGIGSVVCLFGDRKQFFRRDIAGSEVGAEVSRYDAACTVARNSLFSDIARHSGSKNSAIRELLETHLLILDDPSLVAKIKRSISADLVNSEWAIQKAINEYSSMIKSDTDQHLREKFLDVEDVAVRLLTAISGDDDSPRFERGTVVAATELRASTVLGLREAGISAIVSEHGGWTSHASILAREFEIPSVTGIARLFGYLSDGDQVAVDGYNGEVIFQPTADTRATLNQRVEASRAGFASSHSFENKDLTTLDGKSITIRTNTVSSETYKSSVQKGAKGIGLYRSEGLIGKYGHVPTEGEQTEEYRQIAEVTGSYGIRIRTFDIDSEVYPGSALGRQRNPALGLRAIRLGLVKLELLIPQIRALLRASYNNNVAIVVPMITSTGEINAVREIVEQEANNLRSSGVPIGNPHIGAMIEIPSAALLADQIAKAADFLCLGTNDLAQYVLAADRDNESVSEWFRTLHPAMLRIVRSVIGACKAAKKQLVICGEMAGSPFYVPVLIGMGADDLSVGPNSVEPVSQVIAGIAFEEAATLVREIEVLSSADEVEHIVAETAKSKWLHLYPPGYFEQYGP